MPTTNPDSYGTQRDSILNVLTEARGGWVPAPELAKIALQFQTRIKELRDKCGLRIENDIQREGRKQFSRYRLVPNQSLTPDQPRVALEHSRESPEGEPRVVPLLLFSDLKPELEYPD